MVNIKKFPRGINSDQTISASGSYGLTKRVRPGPGLKQQAQFRMILKIILKDII